MSYCVNPVCPKPENPANALTCLACGAKLLLRDRYRMEQMLGQGGFGATFLGRDEALPGQPHCVVKQLRPTSTAPHVLKMARDLFRREAKTLGKIGNHPQIPRLLDYFEATTEFYLVQEYISGLTLQQEVKQSGPFSEQGVKQFLSECLPILQYIHSQEVIHRDIKPANLIRRDQDRRLVLIDFGAVKDQVNPDAASLSDQTALTSYAIGTPGYAPPEQMAMRPVYASDIYALGVTCLFLLTAKTPKDMNYNPATGETMWRDHVHVSDHFAEVLSKMLEVSVRHRYQSAEEVLRALDLEPYLESLAQGMINAPTATSNGAVSLPRSIARDDTPSEGGSSLSRTAQMAKAIRARRAKMEPSPTTRLASGRPAASRSTSGPLTAGQPTSAGKKSMPTRKLTADDIVTYYTKGRRDFAAQDLSNLNLQGANLESAMFHDAKLLKTNLQGACLSEANFSQANLQQTILRDAVLTKAYLNHSDLQGADLRGADLTGAYLTNANLRGANLCGAILTGAKVTDEQLAVAKTNWMTVRPDGKRGIFK